MAKFLLSGHLYHSEGSPAVNQWPQEVNVDEFSIFVPKAGQLEIQIVQEQLVTNYHLTPLRLS